MTPIRNAGPNDLTQISELLRHLNRYPDEPVPDAEGTVAAWQAMLGSGLLSVLVADDEGVLASTCTLVIVPNLTHEARSFGVIENVVTLPAYRGRGLGTAVLKAAQQRAWAAGCYKVMLATGSRRPETLRFYEQAGFSRGSKTAFEVRLG